MVSNVDTQQEDVDPKIRFLSSSLNASLFPSYGTDLVVKIDTSCLPFTTLIPLALFNGTLHLCVCQRYLFLNTYQPTPSYRIRDTESKKTGINIMVFWILQSLGTIQMYSSRTDSSLVLILEI